MSCSIPSIRIMIFEHNMQLKIIIQNKLKSSKPAFLKNIIVFFPEVALFCVYAYSVTSSALFNFMVSPPVEGGLQWLIQCVLQCLGKEQKKKSWRVFFFFLLAVIMVWGKGKGMNVAVLVPTALGHVLMCGGALCRHLRPPVLLFFRQHLLCAVNRRQLETVWKSSETGGKCHTFFCCWTLLPPWLHLPVLAGICREKRNSQGFSCCFRSSSQKITPVKSGLFAEVRLWIFVQWRLGGRWTGGSNYWGETWGPGVPRAAGCGKSASLG